jgi:hypothetical protein
VITCASGCRITGQHETTCEGECRGCLPRPAETGVLCAWCWRRLEADMGIVPALVAHLRALGEPHAESSPPSDGRAMGDPAFQSILPAQWLAADELTSLVSSWALVVIEEHPVQPMRGPTSAPWFGDVVAWLTPHLPWCAAQEWVAEMRRELARDVSTMRARWPMLDDAEPVRRVDVPCPRCDQMSLMYTPPREQGQPFVVACQDPDCARVFSEDEWDRLKMLALRAGTERMSA